MKINFAVTPKEIALPVEVVFDFQKTHCLIGVRLLCFFVQIVYIVPSRDVLDSDEKLEQYLNEFEMGESAHE